MRFFYFKVFVQVMAAVVAIGGLASSAKAEIIYHPADITISDGTYNLDLNGDGVIDFSITSGSNFWGPCTGEVYVSEAPTPGNGTVLGPLGKGDPIGPGQVFGGSGVLEFLLEKHLEICWWYSHGGPWFSAKSGYLGLTLQVGGQTYYGWAKLMNRLDITHHSLAVVLVGYAYETIPGRAIKAGETSYVSFNSGSLNFGPVTIGTTASRSVLLANLGPDALTITNSMVTGVNAADFASLNGNPPCGGSIASGATCRLTFTFTPSLMGRETAAFYVYDNSGSSPQELQLDGTGQ
jgi:hypothetical protein